MPTLVQVIARCHQETSHYLHQCWPSSMMLYGINRPQCVNSLWPSDAIKQQGTESTLAQVMAYCLTAPSHYLNQCWLVISKVLWHSSDGIVMRRSEDTNQQNKIENYIFRIAFRSPRDQWVNHYYHNMIHWITFKSPWLKFHKITITWLVETGSNYILFSMQSKPLGANFANSLWALKWNLVANDLVVNHILMP